MRAQIYYIQLKEYEIKEVYFFIYLLKNDRRSVHWLIYVDRNKGAVIYSLAVKTF